MAERSNSRRSARDGVEAGQVGQRSGSGQSGRRPGPAVTGAGAWHWTALQRARDRRLL